MTEDDVSNLRDLVRHAEKNTDNPVAALAMLAELAERRIATRKAPRGAVEGDESDDRDQTPPVTHAPGGAMPSHTTSAARTRRPFLGYDREREAYERAKPDLLSRAQGQFVALVGDEMVGPFEGHEEAERAGYARFGLGPLFIKQVLAEEPVIEVTRFLPQ